MVLSRSREWLCRENLPDLKRGLHIQYQQQLRTLRRRLRAGQYRAFLASLSFSDPYNRTAPYLLKTILDDRGIEDFTVIVDRLRRRYPDSSLSSEAVINSLAYGLLAKDKINEAVRIFKWNAESFPDSANAQDSLGEAYDRKKDVAGAVAAYTRALQINPNYGNARTARRYLQEHNANQR